MMPKARHPGIQESSDDVAAISEAPKVADGHLAAGLHEVPDRLEEQVGVSICGTWSVPESNTNLEPGIAAA
jgi:hypothetical protein